MSLEANQIIMSMEHPEWGTWRVLRKYDEGIWEIRGRSGERILSEDEFERFWSHTELVPDMANLRLPTTWLDSLYINN